MIGSLLSSQRPCTISGLCACGAGRSQSHVSVTSHGLNESYDGRIRSHLSVDNRFIADTVEAGQGTAAENHDGSEVEEDLCRIMGRIRLLPRYEPNAQRAVETGYVDGFRETQPAWLASGVRDTGLDVWSKVGAARVHLERAP